VHHGGIMIVFVKSYVVMLVYHHVNDVNTLFNQVDL
jgi:hypothetical protein